MSRRSSRARGSNGVDLHGADEEPDEQSEFDADAVEEDTQSDDVEEKAKKAKAKKASAKKPAKKPANRRQASTQEGEEHEAPSTKAKTSKSKPLKASSGPPDEAEVKALFDALSGEAKGSAPRTIGREQVEQMATKLGLPLEDDVLEAMMTYASEGGDGPSTSNKRQRLRISLEQFQHVCSQIYAYY
jgi:hypothetical protein